MIQYAIEPSKLIGWRYLLTVRMAKHIKAPFCERRYLPVAGTKSVVCLSVCLSVL